MTTKTKLLERFLADESGLETVEYSIIVGLVVGSIVLIIFAIGDWVFDEFVGLHTDIGLKTDLSS